jgi:hypothetical protein
MTIKRCPADAAFSIALRHSRFDECEHCKRKDGKMECAHIFGRRCKSVRWDTLNALCLCHSCHHTFTANPLDFTSWLQEYVGQGYLDILNEKRNQILKTTKPMRQDIAKHYRVEYKRMVNEGNYNLVSYQ